MHDAQNFVRAYLHDAQNSTALGRVMGEASQKISLQGKARLESGGVSRHEKKGRGALMRSRPVGLRRWAMASPSLDHGFLQDVLQHDGLGVGHLVEGAHDAFGADAGVLVATEGLLEGAVEARAVDDHAAGLKLAGEFRAGLLVGREDAAGQTELRGVGDLDGLLGGLEGDDGHHPGRRSPCRWPRQPSSARPR